MSPLEEYGIFFSTLKSDFKDEDFHRVFAENCYFCDPFQEVIGVEPLILIFRHMYATLKEPRFIILDAISEGDRGYLRWRFVYNDTHFDGISHILFNKAKKVTSHVDYWDSGINVYAKIPLLGSIIRFLQKYLRASR